MSYLKPNQERAKVAVILIGIVLAMDFISVISDFFQYDLLKAVLNGNNVSISEAEGNDLRQQIVAILSFLAYLVSAITFIMWFRRAYYNLHQKVSYLSRSEGMAAGGWFIPILSWFVPYTIMNELYVETRKILVDNNPENGFYLKKTYMGWWWALWIISNIVGQIVFRVSLNSESIDELMFVTQISMINSIIGIPLAFITIKVIKDYSEAETLMHQIENDEVNNTETVL